MKLTSRIGSAVLAALAIACGSTVETSRDADTGGSTGAAGNAAGGSGGGVVTTDMFACGLPAPRSWSCADLP